MAGSVGGLTHLVHSTVIRSTALIRSTTSTGLLLPISVGLGLILVVLAAVFRRRLIAR